MSDKTVNHVVEGELYDKPTDRMSWEDYKFNPMCRRYMELSYK